MENGGEAPWLMVGAVRQPSTIRRRRHTPEASYAGGAIRRRRHTPEAAYAGGAIRRRRHTPEAPYAGGAIRRRRHTPEAPSPYPCNPPNLRHRLPNGSRGVGRGHLAQVGVERLGRYGAVVADLLKRLEKGSDRSEEH